MIVIAFALLLMIGPASAASQSGKASLYSSPQATACGQRFNPRMLTAAHRSLPCGTKVTVRNKKNGRSVVVEITDRGPFNARIIDVSRFAAELLGMVDDGVVPVTISW